MRSIAPQIFSASVIAVVLIFYGLIAWRRKTKLRALANKLGATYISVGWFAPGQIQGADFYIDVHTVGYGKNKRYYTTIKVAAPPATNTYLIKVGFFECYPNWQAAMVLGTETQRAFVTTISYPRYQPLTAEQRNVLHAWLERRPLNTSEIFAALKAQRIHDLLIQDAAIKTSLKGVVLNLNHLQGSLNALRLLAGSGK